MGRKRLSKNRELPKGVYRDRRNYVYRAYLGRENGRNVYSKAVTLCSLNAPTAALYAAYAAVIGEATGNIDWLLAEYHKSTQFRQLKHRTQQDYESYAKTLKGYPTKGGRLGDAALDRITKRTIRSYLDKYKNGSAPVAANRHIQYLKAAWNWAEERYEQVPANPCTGVRLNRTESRTRYVTQDEFQAFAATCTSKSYITIFMELAYLCRARWSEVAGLKIQDCVEEGIIVRRSKGSEGEITAWTPRLRAAVDAAKAFNQGAPSLLSGTYLIHDKAGLRVSQNGFQSAWRRAMNKWMESGGEHFTFHDLKAAGYSDQKKQDAGHKSEKMHNVYNRKLRIVEPAE